MKLDPEALKAAAQAVYDCPTMDGDIDLCRTIAAAAVKAYTHHRDLIEIAPTRPIECPKCGGKAVAVLSTTFTIECNRCDRRLVT